MASSSSLELVFAGAKDEGIDCWNVHTGAYVREIKSEKLHAFHVIDNDSVVVSQSDKASAHVFSSKTGQTKTKSTLPERIETFAVTHCHTYLAGGGTSGESSASCSVSSERRFIFLIRRLISRWFSFTQAKLTCGISTAAACSDPGMHISGRSVAALFRNQSSETWRERTESAFPFVGFACSRVFSLLGDTQITAACFSADGNFLITAGEDATLSVWNMVEVLGAEEGASVPPYVEWTGHTLPITGLLLACLPVFACVPSGRAFGSCL